MRSLVLLAVFGLFSAASAVTEVEIRNHTSHPVHIDHITDNYSKIPTDDLRLADQKIAPGKTAVVHFSIISLSYLDFLEEILNHQIEKDGIYCHSEEKIICITWEDMSPSAEALPTKKQIPSKQEKQRFVFTIEED
ncbi:MAG: hypothetical protein KBD04_02980 [Proteobacteria bacterium]|nr:hypothetical protein [Pseudomonadota bacterium]